MTKLNEKPLSKMLEEIEPVFRFTIEGAQPQWVDRKDYDKLKQVAIELAKGSEDALTTWQTDWNCGVCVQVNEEAYKPLSESFARAKDIIGGE